ncbi:MAG TPA: hypothetical protein VF103_04805, partial [Polyangiaceae bacterium]
DMTNSVRLIGSVATTFLALAACTATGSQTEDGDGGGAGSSAGGAAMGGSGGVTAAGGTQSGGVSTGGTGGAATGGAGASGGGTTGTGGIVGDGGTGALGGATSGAAGITSGSGGKAGSGGASGTGGKAGSGGASGSGAVGAGGATPSTGCGKAPPASMRYSIDVSGTMREYILAVPTNYDQNRPYRLIFAWHPLGGNAQQVAGNGNNGYYGLRSASNGAAILVSPEGLPFQGTNLGWANTNGRDIAFLRAMLDRFKTEMCIDESRIFSTGFSFGGMMSFAVGCSGLARAIAPMAGNTMVSGCTNGTTPVAVMGFHGDHDSVVDIDGGRAGRDVFVGRNGCMSQTMTTQPTWCDSAGANFQPCSCVSYQGCQAGYPVTWCEYNGDHMQAPNSGATIWSFFSQF